MEPEALRALLTRREPTVDVSKISPRFKFRRAYVLKPEGVKKAEKSQETK